MSEQGKTEGGNEKTGAQSNTTNQLFLSRRAALTALGTSVAGLLATQTTRAQSQGPIKIADWNDLDNVRTDLEEDYVLVNDLDSTTAGYDSVAGPNANGGKGFEPIGEAGIGGSPFAGRFDGNGYTIDGLTIDRPSEDGVGLFAAAGDFGFDGDFLIQDVSITNADVTGNFEDIGTLVGTCFNGEIKRCFVSGTVTTGGSAEGFDSGRAVGGLGGRLGVDLRCSRAEVDVNASAADAVGGFGGLVDGRATRCSASGDVVGIREVGGFAGTASDIDRCLATGQVASTDASVGGLLGRTSEATVEKCYSTGDVEYRDDAFNFFDGAGGLIGEISEDEDFSDEPGPASTIRDSYAAGTITTNSATNTGGIVGVIEVDFGDEIQTDIIDSYWDTDTTGEDDSTGGTSSCCDDTSAPGGTGLTTTEMTGSDASSNMSGFDFETEWVTTAESYPELRPGAGFGIYPTPALRDQPVRFDAGEYCDPDSAISTFEWDWDNDGTFEAQTSSPTTSNTFTTAGEKTITLRMTADDGTTATATRTLSVLIPPTPAFTVSPAQPVVDLPATFDASGSTDPDGTISRYEWRVDGQVVGTGRTLEYTFQSPGNHEVSLTVTDNDGLTATLSKTVTAVVFGSAILALGQEVGPPKDCDSDGLFEDVNGDGRVDARDQQALNVILSSHTRAKRLGLDPGEDNGVVQRLTDAQKQAFDFNGDDMFDSRDVLALGRQINRGTACENPE